MSTLTVRFWGVRGSVPAPINNAAIEDKVVRAIQKALNDRPLLVDAHPDSIRKWMREKLGFAERATYGGNTTCVEVRAGGDLIILDMGTGLRELGEAMIPEIFKNKGIKVTILQSHVHWDHIQGYPFWAPIYLSRKLVDQRCTFYGGLDWDKPLKEALRDQMATPMFPVPHLELEQTGMHMDFNVVYDGREIVIPHSSGDGDIRVLCRKLNHPQETYGYRIEYGGKVVAFCTDHEPYAGTVPYRPLVELAQGADLFITDCQYTHEEYAGVGKYRIQKMGWGHSFPEYIAMVAQEAKAKRVITTHHDPKSSDDRVVEIAEAVEEMGGVATLPAYEGLVLEC